MRVRALVGPVLDWLVGPLAMARRTWPSVLAILTLWLAAAITFKWFHPNFTDVDAAYAAISTITTLGDYGDVGTMAQDEKVILIVLVLLAVGVAANAINEIVSVFAQRELWEETLTRRRVGRMDRHAIVIGRGPCPREIVKKLGSLGVEHVVVLPAGTPPAEVEALAPAKVLAGDLKRHATLVEAGIARAAQVEIALEDDALALVVTMNARQLNPKARIVVNVDDEDLTGHFRTAGANVVIGSSHVIGRIMAVAGVTEHVSGMIFSDVAGMQKEIGVFHVADRSFAAGKTIADAGVADHAWVLGLVRDRTFQWEMNRESKLVAGDQLVVLGEAKSFEALRQLVVGSPFLTSDRQER